jgi:hypothetical protein
MEVRQASPFPEKTLCIRVFAAPFHSRRDLRDVQ